MALLVLLAASLLLVLLRRLVWLLALLALLTLLTASLLLVLLRRLVWLLALLALLTLLTPSLLLILLRRLVWLLTRLALLVLLTLGLLLLLLRRLLLLLSFRSGALVAFLRLGLFCWFIWLVLRGGGESRDCEQQEQCGGADCCDWLHGITSNAFACELTAGAGIRVSAGPKVVSDSRVESGYGWSPNVNSGQGVKESEHVQ